MKNSKQVFVFRQNLALNIENLFLKISRIQMFDTFINIQFDSNAVLLILEELTQKL